MLVGHEIRPRQRTDKDFWIRRPLKNAALDYASFKIFQLQALYHSKLESMATYPHLLEESQRYADLYKESRPPANAWYLDHNFLPQEILHRQSLIRDQFDPMGTRVCAGCRRTLHQDSFRDSFRRRWTLRLGEHGKLCYTCAEARTRRPRTIS
jgi:hypothetical protein